MSRGVTPAGKWAARFNKDFYGLGALASSCDFNGEDLSEAIRAKFARRRTPLPTKSPVALTGEFAGEQCGFDGLFISPSHGVFEFWVSSSIEMAHFLTTM